jgi:hypothetical protein
MEDVVLQRLFNSSSDSSTNSSYDYSSYMSSGSSYNRSSSSLSDSSSDSLSNSCLGPYALSSVMGHWVDMKNQLEARFPASINQQQNNQEDARNKELNVVIWLRSITTIMVVRAEVLDREPEGSERVVNAHGQQNILKGNFNMISLKLYQAATEEDPCLEVMRCTREQKQDDWRGGAEARTKAE